MNGARERSTGIRNSPQYQDRIVNTRSDAENETGNAKLPNVRFRDGNREIWSRMSTASQLITKKTCCSADRRIAPAQFTVESSLYTRDHPVAEIIDRGNATGKGHEILDEMIYHGYENRRGS